MRRENAIAAMIVGVLLALTAAPPTARAQVPCSTVCARYDQGQCVEYTHYSCNGAAPSAPASSYGAIAYGSKSGAWGTSYHWGSEAKAESSAMQTCKQHGDDCEVMVWFDRKCGAVVAAKGDVAFWGLGDSEAEARTDALAKCDQGGGNGCKVQAYECSK
jgi:Domain of unknown function (DUF4189)